MGIEISNSNYRDADYTQFRDKLQDNLHALKAVLARPGFGVGEASMGAELEIYIIDSEGKPLYANQEILDLANDPQLTLELNRYNLEYNLSPFLLKNQAFLATEQEIIEKLAAARKVAESLGGRIVPIGILPTLGEKDFGPHSMTERNRYHVLVDQLKKSRGEAFQIDINGSQPLQLNMEDVTLEGANTSFQIHYRVEPSDYANIFNSIQLVTPLVMAVSGNSPGLFGHDLWQETRIPLFKQSIDTRIKDRYSWHQSARVSFGHGWVRRGAFELFAESVELYPPFFPICGEKQPLAQVREGNAPALEELRLHQSSVWWWNRPVYDDVDEGQLRIEMRALPAGPTPIDMVANALFFIGLAEGMKEGVEDLLPAIPFELAEYNFYRAAQHGLDAKLVWPNKMQSGCVEKSVLSLLEEHLVVAETGLAKIGIGDNEIARYLSVIRKRVEQRQTGARWQQKTFAHLCESKSREQAAYQMLELYLEHSLSNVPVSDWEELYQS